MTRPYPFDEFPEKESDWREVVDRYDRIFMWLGYWRDQIPADAVRQLQDVVGLPKWE
jgi:hypothetical protein